MTTTTSTLETRYRDMIRAIGAGFHPDTSGEEYSSLPDGLTSEQVDAVLDAVFANGIDVYGIALDVIHEIDSDDRYDRNPAPRIGDLEDYRISPTLEAEQRFETDKVAETSTYIARNVLGIDSLSEQGRDSLDFHEVSVVALREALAAAFEAGRKAAR